MVHRAPLYHVGQGALSLLSHVTSGQFKSILPRQKELALHYSAIIWKTTADISAYSLANWITTDSFPHGSLLQPTHQWHARKTHPSGLMQHAHNTGHVYHALYPYHDATSLTYKGSSSKSLLMVSGRMMVSTPALLAARIFSSSLYTSPSMSHCPHPTNTPMVTAW